jgi:hypothetical protein
VFAIGAPIPGSRPGVGSAATTPAVVTTAASVGP